MKELENKPYFTTSELAKLLQVSRITVFNYVKKGSIKAHKFGKTYLISRLEAERLIGEKRGLSESRKEEINQEIDLIIKKYGEALKKLGQE